jgi:hypothetical protein
VVPFNTSASIPLSTRSGLPVFFASANPRSVHRDRNHDHLEARNLASELNGGAVSQPPYFIDR